MHTSWVDCEDFRYRRTRGEDKLVCVVRVQEHVLDGLAILSRIRWQHQEWFLDRDRGCHTNESGE